MPSINRVDYDELDFEYSAEGVLCLWQEQPFTGVGVEQYPDGSPRAESVFENGVDTQTGKEWYPSGQLKKHTVAIAEPRRLQVTKWYENGALKSRTTYEAGIKVAEQGWNEEGALIVDFLITEQDKFYPNLLLRRAGQSQS
jgi:antitoxin component YwqK of YwqJK toxin-antitoxin module